MRSWLGIAFPAGRSHRLKAKFTNPVLHRGHVYGLDDGIMVCLEIEAGLLKWKEGKYGHGQVLLVGQLLLVMAENGEVILIDPQPDQLRELTRLPALSGKTWNPPALAGEYLIVRNDKEAACFRLPVMESASYLSKRSSTVDPVKPPEQRTHLVEGLHEMPFAHWDQ